jgi:hypothetical protein
MSEQSVVAVYDSMVEAEEAVPVLDRGGSPTRQVSIITLKHEETVKGGEYLVVAHGDSGQVASARNILQATGASEGNSHAEAVAQTCD